MQRILWPLFLLLFAGGVALLPDATWQTVLITQIVLLPTGIFLMTSPQKPLELRPVILATALLGLACASYLAFHWYAGGPPQCSSSGCAIAQSSKYATLFFGWPTSTVGVLGYSAILLSLLSERLRLLTVSLGIFGLATSWYLTYSSIFVLHTTCQWCLGSATAMTAIGVLAYIRLFRQWFA